MARSATRRIFTALERRDPGVGDDETIGILVGTRWKNLLTGVTYTCRNPRSAAAWWAQTDPPPDPPAPPPTPAPTPFVIPTTQTEMACAANVAVGKFVYLAATGTGSGSGSLVAALAAGVQARIADPSNRSTMPAVGVCVAKLSDTSCIIQRSGFVAGIFTNLEVGEPYNVAPGGGVARLAPVPIGGTSLWAQKIGTAWARDVLEVKPSSSLRRISI